MLSIQRITASAVAAAVSFSILSGVPASAQMMPGARLTSVKSGSLQARRLLPNGAGLTGLLLQVTTCNRVAFQRSPATIVPPIYRAVQYPVRRGPCGQIVLYMRASIAIPRSARAVHVQAANGNFTVPVH